MQYLESKLYIAKLWFLVFLQKGMGEELVGPPPLLRRLLNQALHKIPGLPGDIPGKANLLLIDLLNDYSVHSGSSSSSICG
jgi:hypothetical protein